MNHHQNENILGIKTKRGRKSKQVVLDEIKENYKQKDDLFCKNDIRLKKDNDKIELQEIKEELNIMKNIFSKEKPENIPNELINLNNIEVDKYFIIKYWDEKEKTKENDEYLERIFVQYLKEYSQKVNKNYFFLILKLIVFLKEYINSKKTFIEKNKKKNQNEKNGEEKNKKKNQNEKNGEEKNKKKNQNEKNGEVSDELYVANVVKNLGNDFFILFLGKKRGENEQTLFTCFETENIPDIRKELKELYINLCYWLDKNKYADSFLIEYKDDQKKSDDDEKPKKKNQNNKRKKFNVK